MTEASKTAEQIEAVDKKAGRGSYFKILHAPYDIFLYIYTASQISSHPKNVLFLMKQVKRHNGFIYYTKYKFA